MKKILITGANSYIGLSFQKWLQQWQEGYKVDTVDMINGKWKQKDFSEFDAILHVAGIAHIKETKENASLYYKVNCDMAYEVAEKAKIEGVKQFIFLSSMSVYGVETGVINKDTIPVPKSNYGKSKLQAERLIKSLEGENFKIAIVRPPMVYGESCKGNYIKLAEVAIKSPFFPNIKNKRSMIYIDNLSEFLRCIIDNFSSGLFFPQNEEYVCTSIMVKLIAETHGKRIKMTRVFNLLLRFANISVINKVFGSLVYEKSLSEYKVNYRVKNLKESIISTESRI